MDRRFVAVGPENPIVQLPPGLLSKAIDLTSRLGSPEWKRPEFIAFLAVIFDLCRNVFGQEQLGKTAILRVSPDHTILQAYGNFEIDPVFEYGHLHRICLRPLVNPNAFIEDDPTGWKKERDEVIRHSQKKLALSGNRSTIARAVLPILWNCPYCPSLNSSFQHKWRAVLLGFSCRYENDDSLSEIENEIKAHPRLFMIRGWCGGNILHPSSRLGNVRHLQLLLSSLESGVLQKRLGVSPSKIINLRNCDGCTPLMIAQLYKQELAAKILLEAGAISGIPDVFGNVYT